MYRVFVVGAAIANGVYTWRRLWKAPPDERRREILQFAAWPLLYVARHILVVRLAPQHEGFARQAERISLGCSALFVFFMSLVTLVELARQFKEPET